MTLVEFLDKFAAEYVLEDMECSGCVVEISLARRGSATEAAKSVVIKADGKRYMCVLPVYRMIDVGIIKHRLGVTEVYFVDEYEERSLFPSCEAGAEPPFGTLYGLPTLMDEALEQDDYIVFQGERYDKAVVMPMAEYKRLASPRIFSFSHPGS